MFFLESIRDEEEKNSYRPSSVKKIRKHLQMSIYFALIYSFFKFHNAYCFFIYFTGNIALIQEEKIIVTSSRVLLPKILKLSLINIWHYDHVYMFVSTKRHRTRPDAIFSYRAKAKLSIRVTIIRKLT